MLSRMKNKKWFRLASGVLGLQIFLTSALPAAALFGSPSVPSASQNAAEMEQRYHINPGAMQDQGESLNVAGGKKVSPEVSLFFSPSDPKEGEKVTARSFPTYFSTDTSKLYFTWYLQRAVCATGAVTADCDLDGNGLIGPNDWKIAAHRILASNDFDVLTANYGADTDADGYAARFGGDNRVNVPNHCAFHDNTNGENYEIAIGSSSIAFDGCPSGSVAVCMQEGQDVTPTVIDPNVSGVPFTGVGSGAFYVSGTPYCDPDPAGGDAGVVGCTTGTPCCVANAARATTCETPITACTSSGTPPNPICRHLFPVAPGVTSGDGVFGAGEERFWQTNPNDADTSDNGNKDEANVIGLGRETFTWNYIKGDKVGVVVEGTSMVPTKHKDSSNMIMWAFSKNKTSGCRRPNDTGSYTKIIEGYSIVIPTIEIDLNDCLIENLVDPTEGGQATNLELSVSASPDDPVNDTSEQGDGDVLEAVASIDNGAQGMQDVYFDWRVEISPDGTSNPPANNPWVNITNQLNNLSNGRKLLSQVRGNGVNKVELNLNIRNTDGVIPPGALPNNTGYLRFRVDAAENFSSGASRRGRSSVVVKFNASQDRMLAHRVTVAGDPARVSLDQGGQICTGTSTDPRPEAQSVARLETKLCRVIKNEIIGVSVPNQQLTNFNWTINGQPLVCNSKVSAGCNDTSPVRMNFFPIIGSVGDVFTITVTANQVTGAYNSAVSQEQVITISRAFKIVEPEVAIIPNAGVGSVWQKALGQYVDTDGQVYPELSKDTLETAAGNVVALTAQFTPDFLGARTPPQLENSWSVDGVVLGTANAVTFPANKIGKSVYNVSLSSVYRPSPVMRQAMEDIWGLSALDMTEKYFSSNTQVEQPDGAAVAQSGMKKYYALVASYLPASVLFSLKVLFSVFLILFASGVVFAVIPNTPEGAVVRSRRASE